ncbi:MAG: hypothetical protein R2738_02945 [Bacteroides graminisolvens]
MYGLSTELFGLAAEFYPLLLGFSSCDSNGSEMWLAPYATYGLKVVDAQKQLFPI